MQSFTYQVQKTTQTGGSWSTAMPSWSPGMYVWTRSLITYTSGTPAQETTTPLVSSEWEAINEIEIGGRNYFSASQLKGLEPNNTTNTLEISETGLVYVKEVTAGEVYTLSRNSITVGAKFGYVFTIDEPGDGVACTTYVGDYEDDLVVAGITIPATYNYIVIYLTSEGKPYQMLSLNQETRQPTGLCLKKIWKNIFQITRLPRRKQRLCRSSFITVRTNSICIYCFFRTRCWICTL